MEGARFYAEVKDDVIDIYNAPVSGISGSYELYKGMVEPVTGMTGNYARLASGQWVNKNRVNIAYKPEQSQGVVRRATYQTGNKYDIFELTMTSPAAAIVDFDGQKLVLRLLLHHLQLCRNSGPIR